MAILDENQVRERVHLSHSTVIADREFLLTTIANLAGLSSIVRTLNIIDEFMMEALVIRVKRSLHSVVVVDAVGVRGRGVTSPAAPVLSCVSCLGTRCGCAQD